LDTDAIMSSVRSNDSDRDRPSALIHTKIGLCKCKHTSVPVIVHYRN